ncbi:ATP-binding protein [Planctellipticum variicoloris]|uniref:ATP-binding protein n=1 Tax=Planctellipticum variicoloris TaxID=3064265 RepID=UPI003013D5B6
MRGFVGVGDRAFSPGVAVPKATLLVIQGVEQGARYELGDRPYALGRGLQNEIRVLDTEVSRIHASIHRVGDGYVLTDRNSSNGSFVNGSAIRSRPLANGDQIQIGRTVLLFSQEGAAAAPPNLDRVKLLNQHDPADRSNIVSKVSDDSSRPGGFGSVTAAAQSVVNLRALYQIAEESVRPSVSLEQLLQRVLDLTIEAVGADRGCVLLTDAFNGEIRPQAVSYRQAGEHGSRMPVSRTIVDYVVRSRQGVRSTDAQHDTRFDAGNSIVQSGIREAMCVPLQGRSELMGVIYVDITTPADRVLIEGRQERFSEDQLRLLVAIGRQAALAVENNRYQNAIVKAERLAAMGQTIATLSHHIKNILQGVRGGSYLIDLGLKDHNEDLVRKGWTIVEKNQNKIYHLVMDMLTFSKDRKPALQRVQLNDTVREIVELLQVRAGESHVELHWEPAGDLPDSTFDPEGIHRAVLNIVINAIDAAEGADHAMVRIATGYDPNSDFLWVRVTDNGPGIPEEQRLRIFNIFESTKGARGTGLGLPVSQKILREHGGEITVESRLEEGTTFTLTWPRNDDDHSPLSGRTMA